MANNLKSNPIIIDTWTGDVTITEKGAPIVVKKIRLLSAADGDIFALDNAVGTKIFQMVQTGANDVVEVDFGDDGFRFSEGVVIDVSDCTGLGANDIVWIYTV